VGDRGSQNLNQKRLGTDTTGCKRIGARVGACSDHSLEGLGELKIDSGGGVTAVIVYPSGLLT